MHKYGVEIEFFLADAVSGGQLYLPSEYGLDTDEFPILGEVRSGVHTNVFLAIMECMYLLRQAQENVSKAGLFLIYDPSVVVPLKTYDATLRQPNFHKGQRKEHNLYGKTPKLNGRRVYSGLHIHFSDNLIIKVEGKSDITTYSQLDIPHMVRHLDKALIDDIRGAKRTPGWYELKSWGFEYRSLPAWIVNDVTNQPNGIDRIVDAVESIGW